MFLTLIWMEDGQGGGGVILIPSYGFHLIIQKRLKQ